MTTISTSRPRNCLRILLFHNSRLDEAASPFSGARKAKPNTKCGMLQEVGPRLEAWLLVSSQASEQLAKRNCAPATSGRPFTARSKRRQRLGRISARSCRIAELR